MNEQWMSRTKNKERAGGEGRWPLTGADRQAGQIEWQSGRQERTNKHEYLYCMDNDMVLEMKAETMQIALTLRQLPLLPTTWTWR